MQTPSWLAVALCALVTGCSESSDSRAGLGGHGGQDDGISATASSSSSGIGGAGGDATTSAAGGGGSTTTDSSSSTTSTTTSTTTGTTSTTTGTTTSTATGSVFPPLGGSSAGSGGPAPVDGATRQAQGVTYRLIVPSSYTGQPTPLLLVYSGTEGGDAMIQNLKSVGPMTGTASFVCAVLDGVTYNGDGAAGATVLDDLRASYAIDNDRTYLLSESAGTTAGFALGFQLRPSYFAAYWANDVTTAGGPAQTASELGFAPWGQAGPGGKQAEAAQIVALMSAAGYRVPTPAPYAGKGASQHGSPDQFIAAVSWFAGKTRAP